MLCRYALVTVLAAACNPQPAYTIGTSTDTAHLAVEIAEAEPVATERTICGDDIARELEPELGELLQSAVSYWHGQGHSDIVVGSDDCDIRVVFEAEQGRVAWGTDEAGRARPSRLYLRELRWSDLREHGYRELLLTHEIGHYHLGPGHTESGIMSPTCGL